MIRKIITITEQHKMDVSLINLRHTNNRLWRGRQSIIEYYIIH